MKLSGLAAYKVVLIKLCNVQMMIIDGANNHLWQDRDVNSDISKNISMNVVFIDG